MSLNHILQDSGEIWLDHTGDTGYYRKIDTGRVTETKVTIELEVESLDDNGILTKHKTATVLSEVGGDAKLGDTISVNGQVWEVEELFSDNGVLAGLYITEA